MDYFHMGVNTLTPLRKKVTIILEEVESLTKKKQKKKNFASKYANNSGVIETSNRFLLIC